MSRDSVDPVPFFQSRSPFTDDVADAAQGHLKNHGETRNMPS